MPQPATATATSRSLCTISFNVRAAPLEIDPDLSRRWSGVVAATPALGEELVSTLREPQQSKETP